METLQEQKTEAVLKMQERIIELEKENKTVTRKADEAIADKLLITAKYNEVLNNLNQENDKLQKENAELKEQNKHLYNDLTITEAENAELKADNDARKFAMAMSEKVEKQLREENAELKKEWQEQVQKATDEGYARTLQTIQLSKAKEHIRTLISCLIDWVQEGDKDYCYIAEAEQFLNEVEK